MLKWLPALIGIALAAAVVLSSIFGMMPYWLRGLAAVSGSRSAQFIRLGDADDTLYQPAPAARLTPTHWQAHSADILSDAGQQHVKAAMASNRVPLQQPPHRSETSEQAFAVGHGAFDSLSALQSVPVRPRRVIVSMVPADADPHLAAIVTLAYSLRRAGNALPLVLFYIESNKFSLAARRTAQRAGWQLRVIERVTPFKETPERFTDACDLLNLDMRADVLSAGALLFQHRLAAMFAQCCAGLMLADWLHTSLGSCC